MYENTENPALCPVRAFELYLSKLNPSLDLLWQRPKAFDNFNESDSVLYCNAPQEIGREQSMKRMIGKSIDQSMKIDALLVNWHGLASANR